MGIGSSFKTAAKSSGEAGKKAVESFKNTDWNGKLTAAGQKGLDRTKQFFTQRGYTPEWAAGVAKKMGLPAGSFRLPFSGKGADKFTLSKGAPPPGKGAPNAAGKAPPPLPPRPPSAASGTKAADGALPKDAAPPGFGARAMKWMGNNKGKTAVMAGLGTAAYMSTQSKDPAVSPPLDPYAAYGTPDTAPANPAAHLEGVPGYY